MTTQRLHKLLVGKYRPSLLLHKLTTAGHLGKKSGCGVYEYDKDDNIIR